MHSKPRKRTVERVTCGRSWKSCSTAKTKVRMPLPFLPPSCALRSRFERSDCEQVRNSVSPGGTRDISRWCQPPVRNERERKPRQGRRKPRGAIPSPLPGLAAFSIRVRWLAPPANLPNASGVQMRWCANSPSWCFDIERRSARSTSRSVLSSLTGLAALGDMFPALKRWAIANEENWIPPSVPSA